MRATRQKNRRHDDDDDEDSGRPSPEEIDAWANEALQYARDDVSATLLQLTKYYFGTEFQSKTPAEKEAILRADEDWPEDDDEPANAAGNDWWSQQPDASPTRGEDTYLSYKDVLNLLGRREEEASAKEAFMREMMNAGWSRDRAEERWNVYKLNEGVALGVSRAMNVYGAIAGARAILSGAYKWFIGLGEAGAVRLSGGPGKWVEVQRRGGASLEHQSRMSGKPIIQRDGKFYIEEYEVPTAGSDPVYYDDFRDGKFFEYKAKLWHLFDKNKELFPWVKDPEQFRDQALSQVRAANGIPVIWRVGDRQVEAIRKALGNLPGVIVEP